MWTKTNKEGKATISKQKRRDFNTVEMPFLFVTRFKWALLISDYIEIEMVECYSLTTVLRFNLHGGVRGAMLAHIKLENACYYLCFNRK